MGVLWLSANPLSDINLTPNSGRHKSQATGSKWVPWQPIFSQPGVNIQQRWSPQQMPFLFLFLSLFPPHPTPNPPGLQQLLDLTGAEDGLLLGGSTGCCSHLLGSILHATNMLLEFKGNKLKTTMILIPSIDTPGPWLYHPECIQSCLVYQTLFQEQSWIILIRPCEVGSSSSIL